MPPDIGTGLLHNEDGFPQPWGLCGEAVVSQEGLSRVAQGRWPQGWGGPSGGSQGALVVVGDSEATFFPKVETRRQPPSQALTLNLV